MNGFPAPRLPKVLRNRAKCNECGDVIESTYRWDFVWCQCHNLAVDGGRYYLRRVISGGPDSWTEMAETEERDG